MVAPSPKGVTELLKAWSKGEQEALEELIPLVYQCSERVRRPTFPWRLGPEEARFRRALRALDKPVFRMAGKRIGDGNECFRVSVGAPVLRISVQNPSQV